MGRYLQLALMAINLSHLLVIVVVLLAIQPLIQSKSIQETFKSLQNFEKSQKGQTVKGLHEIKRYLNRYGYLNYNQNDVMKVEDEEFDDHLEDAVKTYQKNFHLNVTGKLDSNTVNQMTKTRCGVADNNVGLQYVFFDGNPKWRDDETQLNFTFDTSINESMLAIIRPACLQGFAEWENVTQFTFTEVPIDSAADITIGYYRREHGDSAPFDGPGNTVAHAFAPTVGKLHFDADDQFSLTPNHQQMDAITVCAHEIGHTLGLGHSTNKHSIMHPDLQAGDTSKRSLQPDDIQGIRTLYSNFFFFY